MNELERQARAEHRAILRRWLVMALAVAGLGAGSVAAGIPSQVAQLLLGIGPPGRLDTVPRHFKYSGYLEVGGQPVHTPDAGTQIVARVYYGPFADAGSAVWSQTSRVPVVDGRFTLELGDTADGGVNAMLPPLPTVARLFLELGVGSPEVRLPRQQLLSVPYAMRSGDVITDDRVISVGSGGDFANIGQALFWLAPKVVRGSLTIQLLDGTHSTGGISLDHPDGARIRIIGNLANPFLVVIDSTASGFSITAPVAQLAGFRLIGPGNLSTTTGIRVVGASTTVGPAVQVQGFEVGVESLFSQVTLNDVQINGRGTTGFGILVSRGAQLQATACTIRNAYLGIGVDGVSTARIDTLTVSDTAGAVSASRSSQIELSGVTQINNASAYGFQAHNSSFIRVSPTTTFSGVADDYVPDLNVIDVATNQSFISQ